MTTHLDPPCQPSRRIYRQVNLTEKCARRVPYHFLYKPAASTRPPLDAYTKGPSRIAVDASDLAFLLPYLFGLAP